MVPAPAAPPAAQRAEPAPAEADSRRRELRDRLAISIVLIPAAFAVVEAGGLLYVLALLLLFALAAGEYSQLFETIGHRPARPVLLGGVLLLVAGAAYPAFNLGGVLPAALTLAALAWHVVDYERGAPAAGTDFALTVAGLFYLGGLGRYFVALRALPDGLWWLLTVLPAMWLADSGAYTFGRLFGRHRMAPRLSPRKTWEGYLGSVAGGGLGGAVLGAVWGVAAGPGSLVNGWTGALAGVLVGALGPMGDLGVSMLKRQVGVKDTGALIAGHGGALDRMDSWLVAVPLGYFVVMLLAALRP
jgi:phosphatidate cytidylyltransferase